MTECNFAEFRSYETHSTYPNLNATLLSDQQQFKQFSLNKIKQIKYHFIADIIKRELMSKRFSKYIVSVDCFDKSWIVLSLTTVSISIASFATVFGAPAGMVSASFSLALSISIGTIKKLFKTTWNKKKKHKKIVMLARSELNSIESKMSEGLINNEISYEDFITIINERNKYRELKESIRMMNSQKSEVKKLTWLKKAKNRH